MTAALEQQTLKSAKLEEKDRRTQTEIEQRQREVCDLRQNLGEMKELNARLRQKVDEEIVDRASRHCQRAEALDHANCARTGASFDQPAYYS